jgi:hypothetical protein
MRTARQFIARADQLAGAGLAAIAGGGAWYVLLMRRIWTASAYGPICSHGSLAQPHCPACYAALGLAALGLALVAAAELGVPARAAAGARRR